MRVFFLLLAHYPKLCLRRRTQSALHYYRSRMSTNATGDGRARVHEIAKVGFATGTNELYDKARPSYPSAALSHIRKALADKQKTNIVEIGAGTGIFTRALLAHPEWSDSVAELKAVEPSEGMRDVFTKTVAKVDPRVSVAEGTFDTTGVEDGWADLVIIAQAFHWCPNFEAAVQEFGRILKPGGVVVLIWNLEDREAAQWVAQLRDVYEPYEGGSPQFRLGLWRQVFDAPSYPKLFHPPEEVVFPHIITGTVEAVTERVCTKSYIAVQSEEERAKILRLVSEIVERGDGKVWVDKDKGIFEYPYTTTTVVLRRK